MAERIIPVELETGIPLASKPRFDLPEPGSGVSNRHHWVFPRLRPSLQSKNGPDPLSGPALRNIREQLVEVDEHERLHDEINQYMAEVWDIPETTIERFGMTALLTAGYIPEKAIYFRGNTPDYYLLSELEREQMWQKNIVQFGCGWLVYNFLRDTVIEQDLGHIDEKDIHEFLFGSPEQKLKMGDFLINAAAEKATEDIRPKYLAAYAGHLLLPTAPSEPQEFVVSILDTEKRQRKARTALARSLAMQRGIELPNAA